MKIPLQYKKQISLKSSIQPSVKVIFISISHVLWNCILLSKAHFIYSWKVIFYFWIHVFE